MRSDNSLLSSAVRLSSNLETFQRFRGSNLGRQSLERAILHHVHWKLISTPPWHVRTEYQHSVARENNIQPYRTNPVVTNNTNSRPRQSQAHSARVLLKAAKTRPAALHPRLTVAIIVCGGRKVRGSVQSVALTPKLLSAHIHQAATRLHHKLNPTISNNDNTWRKRTLAANK